jgi:hypothetical protein
MLNRERLILAYIDSNEDYDLSVFFNLYCTTKKTPTDALEMESILREELAMRFPVTVHIDPSSVEVRGNLDLSTWKS